MTNERAIEILEDLHDWLSNCKPLHWSASEIGKAIYFTKLKSRDESDLILFDYRDWLEFGQPFYHSLSSLISALYFAIETLKSNQ
jgi:hypothetical protein